MVKLSPQNFLYKNYIELTNKNNVPCMVYLPGNCPLGAAGKHKEYAVVRTGTPAPHWGELGEAEWLSNAVDGLYIMI